MEDIASFINYALSFLMPANACNERITHVITIVGCNICFKNEAAIILGTELDDSLEHFY